jgi:hypothetical protein
MIKIGKVELRTSRPKDLDAALIAATGVNAAEMASMLRGYPRAQTIAQALRPFLAEDGPSMPELASEIALADMREVQAKVAKLYGEVETEASPAPPPAGEEKGEDV